MKTVLIIISLCFLYCTISLSFREPEPEISPYYNPKYDTTKIFFSDSAVNTLFVAQSALKTENKGVFEAYIERFKNVALTEQKKYGIPASITLAQGILESNAGRSKMAIKEKNHFGIKCKRKCSLALYGRRDFQMERAGVEHTTTSQRPVCSAGGSHIGT